MKKILFLCAIAFCAGCSPVQKNEELTFEKWEEMDLRLEALPSEQAPTTLVKFEDDFLAFDIPYNPDWSVDGLTLPPYWEDRQLHRITFGPLVGMEGGMGRDCFMETRDPRTLEQAAERMPGCKVRQGKCAYQDTTFELGKIANNEVLITYEGSFGTTQMEMAGKEHNYAFHCWNSDLEPILSSVVLK
jgi:hypothetical protein